MLSWFKQRRQSGVSLGVSPNVAGVAVAEISLARNQAVLRAAEYLSQGGPASNRHKALEELLRAHAQVPVTGLLGLADYNVLLVEKPDVPAAELRAAARWRVKDLIDFPVEDAVIDVFDVPPLKGGRNDMVYVVVARKAAVRAVIDELEACKLTVDSVDIPEFALRNLMTLVPEDVGGVACLWLDEQAGLITITRQGTLYLSRQFEGGRQRLMANGANALGADNEGIADSIVIEIQRSLDYYESQFAQPSVQGVVVVPFAATFDGFDSYLSSQLGISARTLSLGEMIESEVDLSALDPSQVMTTVGAALRDLEAAA